MILAAWQDFLEEGVSFGYGDFHSGGEEKDGLFGGVVVFVAFEFGKEIMDH